MELMIGVYHKSESKGLRCFGDNHVGGRLGAAPEAPGSGQVLQALQAAPDDGAAGMAVAFPADEAAQSPNHADRDR